MKKLPLLLSLLTFICSVYTAKANEVEPPNKITYHTVSKKFGTLYTIAKYYNTTPADIMLLNNMENTTLSLGKVIKVPAKGVDIHMVDPIDKSLWRICFNYKADVDDVMAYNKKTTTNIQIGERIVIPHSYQNVDYHTYTYTKWGKTYQIRTKSLFIEGEQTNEHRIRWYQKRKGNWDLLDEKTVSTGISMLPKGGKAVVLVDFDQNQTPDVIIAKNQGVRSYYTLYSWYTFDYEKDKIRAIKGFDKISSPSYNKKQKRITYIMSGPERKTSPIKYSIDYKNYQLVAKK
jgi:LysM repeat protein